MFAFSSNRALISTTTTTCLPASAASISASTIGDWPLVRYSVCLIASTLGSAAASSTSRCTVVVNESSGWCTSTSRSSRVSKIGASVGTALVFGTNGGYLSAAICRSAIAFRPVRSSGQGSRLIAFSSTPAPWPAGRPRPATCPARPRAGRRARTAA